MPSRDLEEMLVSTNLVIHERIADELLRYAENSDSFKHARAFQVRKDVGYISGVARSRELREQLRAVVLVLRDLLVQIL